MAEADFMRRCMKRATDLGARLFRNNVGTAWVGKVERGPGTVRLGADDVVVRSARPFKAGVAGMSDLIGWVSVQITADMVGQTVAIYSAVETKSAKGRATEEQRNFIHAVCAAGGRAGVAKTDSDLNHILCQPDTTALGVDACRQ